MQKFSVADLALSELVNRIRRAGEKRRESERVRAGSIGRKKGRAREDARGA